MYDSPFWKRPVFQHWRGMLERGRQFPAPGITNAASGEVLATFVIGRRMHRVLVENWNVEEAVEEAQKKVGETQARQPAGQERHRPAPARTRFGPASLDQTDGEVSRAPSSAVAPSLAHILLIHSFSAMSLGHGRRGTREPDRRRTAMPSEHDKID